MKGYTIGDFLADGYGAVAPGVDRESLRTSKPRRVKVDRIYGPGGNVEHAAVKLASTPDAQVGVNPWARGHDDGAQVTATRQDPGVVRAEFAAADEMDFAHQVAAWASREGISKWHRETTYPARRGTPVAVVAYRHEQAPRSVYEGVNPWDVPGNTPSFLNNDEDVSESELLTARK